jgi:hypothetical protein
LSVTTNFSSSQNYGTIKTLTLTDTSTGSGSGITGRLIYAQKYNASYLVPTSYSVSYIAWPYTNGAGDVINIANMLDKDYCLNISVQFFSGSTIYQTKTILSLFTAYSELFLRQLTQAQEANPRLLTDNNFWYNKFKLRTLVDDASQAVTSLNDQTIAQFSLDRAKELTDNISNFF